MKTREREPDQGQEQEQKQKKKSVQDGEPSFERSLEVALERLRDVDKPLRQRLAEAYNYGLIHLSDYDFVESADKRRFHAISETLQASEPGKMATRADRSAEALTLDQACELASEVMELCAHRG